MRLRGKKIVILVAEGFEDLEYWVPVMRLQEEGAEVIAAGPSTEPVSGKNALKAQADVTADEVDASELDGIVVPGGWAPDKLRRYEGITDRKSTRLNSSHANISYAVFFLKKKNKHETRKYMV